MKKFIFISIISLLFVACSSYKSLDLNKLTTGMTKAEVRAIVGAPDRVLAVNDKREGYQEVLEYRTSRNEVYALEFWNDYLTGYEFLYDDVNYVAPIYPPTIWPDYGRPIYVIQGNNRPNRPNRPNQSGRPENNRPTPPNRPSNNTRPTESRPSETRPTTRPTQTNPTTRPTETRPTETRPTTRPVNTESNSSTPTVDRSGMGR